MNKIKDMIEKIRNECDLLNMKNVSAIKIRHTLDKIERELSHPIQCPKCEARQRRNNCPEEHFYDNETMGDD